MSVYLFGRNRISVDDPNFADALAKAHTDKARPLCVCRTPGVPMYVARVGDHHILKRMPSSGAAHDPECHSFEPPAELSGLGEVAGSAIQEDIETGKTTLKLDFSLSKIGARPAPASKGAESDTVRTDGTKLTLRGLLHYLWEQGDLNKWAPGMENKRNWFVVRRALLEATQQKDTKGSPLEAMLFVPETFKSDDKDDIERRRLAKLTRVNTPATAGGGRQLMMLIGEVKDILPARYGKKIVIKHLPNMHFMIDDVLNKRMEKLFATELALWTADEATHLVAVATFGIGASGFANIEELALMVTSPNWLPIEHAAEGHLLAQLVNEGRRFTKGLRYNLAKSKALATTILTDTSPKPVAMYVMPPGAPDDYRDALGDLIETSDFPAWLWKPESEPLPASPDRMNYHPAPITLGAADPDIDDELTSQA